MRPPALIAVTRFGLGPAPSLVDRAASDPRGFVLDQCDRPEAAALRAPGLMTTGELAELLIDTNRPLRPFREKEHAGIRLTAAETEEHERLLKIRANKASGVITREIVSRFEHGVTTEAAFLERLVLFWSNHFAISRKKHSVMRYLTGVFEREVIRPNVLGRFADMLIASTTHPGMLHYLDNVWSIGPSSVIGRRRATTSVNENLAREVLELHTLGAGGAYGEGDVRALALTLTGWIGAFTLRDYNPVFAPEWHEGGPRTILGRRYAATGQDQLAEVLRDLAVHPDTAQHIARKMAVHFVGDDPDPALVQALADTFLVTGGDLRALAHTLALHDAAWVREPAKTVPPYDFSVAALRAIGAPQVPPHFIIRVGRDLAHEVYAPPSPAGWPDADDAFLGGDALLERVDFAREIAKRFARIGNVEAHARTLFGEALDPFVAEAVARAEDRTQALTLLLMSPSFHRR